MSNQLCVFVFFSSKNIHTFKISNILYEILIQFNLKNVRCPQLRLSPISNIQPP